MRATNDRLFKTVTVWRPYEGDGRRKGQVEMERCTGKNGGSIGMSMTERNGERSMRHIPRQWDDCP